LLSTFSFANTNILQTNSTANHISEKLEPVENIEFELNNFGVIICTVTHTVYWYNEYGVYLGSTSATVTVNWGSSLDCAAARHLAQQQAESMAP
jgi:hypothetical protein